MKYRCDMVKDLMPLCLDHAATESSEQTVIEHLAECKECTKYYEDLGKEMAPMKEHSEKDNKFVKLATKIRKRRIGVRVLIGIFVSIWYFVCTNYASGYRLNSRAAADLSGRLIDISEEIACYEWKDNYHFYIYDSYSCYDVIGVEKTWHGWKQIDNNLNWPKWSVYDENIGIEVAGAVCFFRYDEGVQIFPIIPYDENVKTVKVTCYEQTQTKEVKTGEVALFTFDAIDGQSNTVEATAYDAMGNTIYRLETQDNHWIWVPATE